MSGDVAVHAAAPPAAGVRGAARDPEAERPAAAPSPRPAREPRFKPLGPDYWGPNVRHPYWWAAAGLLGAPLALAAVIGLVAWAVALGESLIKTVQGPDPAVYALDTFEMMLVAGFGPAFWPAGAAFLLLWSLRLRGPESFAAAALLSGPIGAIFHGVQSGFNVSVHHVPMVIAVTILHVAMLQLTRLFGGVGRERRGRD